MIISVTLPWVLSSCYSPPWILLPIDSMTFRSDWRFARSHNQASLTAASRSAEDCSNLSFGQEHTNWAVPWARLCRISTFLMFTWTSLICSSSSSQTLEQTQSWHSCPRQWVRHWYFNWDVVWYSDSKMICRSNTLSSIIFILCLSTKLTAKSARGDKRSVSHSTLVSVTRSDYHFNIGTLHKIPSSLLRTWYFKVLSKARI